MLETLFLVRRLPARRSNLLSDDFSTLGNRKYVYDALGRLTSVSDTPAGQACTTRTYAYDANSNRLSRRSNTASAVGVACPAAGGTAGSVVTSTYDSSDRLTSANGFGLGAAAPVYDAWGRTLVLPKQASGGALAVESTYFVNDLARTIKNGNVVVTNTLDPMDRVLTRQTQTTGQATVPLETYAYGDDSDEPIFTRTATAAAPNTQTGWARYVEDPTGDLAAQVTSAGAKTLQVANVRGDTVSEIAATGTPTGLGAKFAVDEFGVPTGTTMGGRSTGSSAANSARACSTATSPGWAYARTAHTWAGSYKPTPCSAAQPTPTTTPTRTPSTSTTSTDGGCARADTGR